MPARESDADRVKFYDINHDDPHLLGLVPEYHDLFQVLYHACVYGNDSCYYVIASHCALLYSLSINFSKKLLKAHGEVMIWIFGEVLE